MFSVLEDFEDAIVMTIWFEQFVYNKKKKKKLFSNEWFV